MNKKILIPVIIIAVIVVGIIAFFVLQKSPTTDNQITLCEPNKEYKHTQVEPITCECPEGYEWEVVEMGWGPCAIEGMTDCPASTKKCVPIED
jgi:hypothetical protein